MYNERENLPIMMHLLSTCLAPHPLSDFHVVIVEDNSPDGTRDVARQLQESYGRDFISVLERPGKLGVGTAYMAALSLVHSEYTILMDSDLSHHPKFIPTMIKKMADTGCDVVTGTRYRDGGGVAGWDMKRKIMSKGANFIGETRIFGEE